MQTKIIVAYDALGAEIASVLYTGGAADGAASPFTIESRAALDNPLVLTGFSRLAFFAESQIANSPWFALDVINSGDPVYNSVRIEQDEPSANWTVKTEVRVRCLLKPYEADNEEYAPFFNFRIIIDANYIVADPPVMLDMWVDPWPTIQNATLATVLQKIAGTPDDAPLFTGIPVLASVLIPSTGAGSIASGVTLNMEFVENGDGSAFLSFSTTLTVVKRFDDLVTPFRRWLNAGANAAPYYGNTGPLFEIDPQSVLLLTQRQPYGFPETMASPGNWVFTLDDLPEASILGLWNDAILTPYLRALHSVQDGHAISVMPKLSPPAVAPEDPPGADHDSRGWSLTGEIWDNLPTIDPIAGTDVFPSTDFSSTPAVRFRSRLLAPMPMPGHSSNEARLFAAEMHGILDHNGQPVSTAALVAPLGSSDLFDTGAPVGIAFLIDFPGPETPDVNGDEAVSVRIGALDLGFITAGTGTAVVDLTKVVDTGQIARGYLTPSRLQYPAPPADPYTDNLPSLSIITRFDAVLVAPGGQDDLPGASIDSGMLNSAVVDDIEPAVLVPYPAALAAVLSGNNTAGPGVPTLSLEARESADRGASQSFLLQIDSGSTGSPAPAAALQRVIVLDRQPFLVARVDAPALTPAGDGQEIGNYASRSGEDANWNLVGSSDGFPLVLPPQTIGETIVKGAGYNDVREDAAIDFRFSPATRTILQPAFFNQRFAEAPWNLRRILGFPGERAPGASLLALRAELLYGMPYQLNTPSLRLAEQSARLGGIPDPQISQPWSGRASKVQQTALRQAQTQWIDKTTQYRSRLAILEPYDVDQATDAQGDPLPLTVTDGLSYQLRRSASRKYPLPEALVSASDPSLTVNGFYHESDGLAGGATYGFESANIYAELLQQPISTNGSLLTAPALSALGGWGYQKAVFCGGLTTLYSNTAMGRVFYYSIERIGRIGKAWNVAKHVIVYERTVTASLQFKSEQPTLDGRPIVRKVREYVEIQEPRRTYPDGPSAAASGSGPQLTGFVEACTFHTTVINVDSAWGADVGDEGWQVPLWRDLPVTFTGNEGDASYLAIANTLRGFAPPGTTAPQPLSDDVNVLVIAGLPANTRSAYKSPQPLTAADIPQLSSVLSAVLNQIIQQQVGDGDLYSPQRFAGVTVSQDAAELISRNVSGPERTRLNRILLEDAYPRIVPVSLARVYPKPQVVLELTTPPGSDAAVVGAVVSEPEKICFFTRTKPIPPATAPTDQNPPALTDAWPATSCIDYGDIPTATPPDIPGFDPSNLDGPMVSAAAFEGGYGAHTWSLDPQPQPVNLVAGRINTPSPVTSNIRNVSLSRAVPVSTADQLQRLGATPFRASPQAVLDVLTNASSLTDSLHSGLIALQGLLPGSGSVPAQLQADLKAARDTLSGEVIGKIKALQTAVNPANNVLPVAILKTSAELCDSLTKAAQSVLNGSQKRFDTLVDTISSAMSDAVNLRSTTQSAAIAAVNSAFAQGLQAFAPLSSGVDSLQKEVETVRNTITNAQAQAMAAIDDLTQSAASLVTSADGAAGAAADILGRFRSQTLSVQQVVRGLLSEADTCVAALSLLGFNALATSLHKDIADVLTELDKRTAVLVGDIDDCVTDVQQVSAAGLKIVTDDLGLLASGLEAGLLTAANACQAPVGALSSSVVEPVQALLQGATDFVDTIQSAIITAIKSAGNATTDFTSAFHSQFDKLKPFGDSQFRLASSAINDTKNGLCATAGSLIVQGEDDVLNGLNSVVSDALNNLDLTGTVEAIRQEIQNTISGFEQSIAPFAATVQQRIGAIVNDAQAAAGTVDGLFQTADPALRLVRALADAPDAIGLSLNRKQIALYFADPSSIKTTPVVALANRVGDDLKAMGLRLPTRELADRFLPDNLPALDLSSLLPDLGGIKFDSLFPGIKVPTNGIDGVVVTHGLDPQTRRAWLKASLDIQLTEDATVFSFGMVTLRLLNARLQATAEVAVSPAGGAKQVSSGSLTGDWELQIGSNVLVTFAATAVTFDESGHLEFSLAADRVRLSSPLNFLSDLLQSIGYSDSGFAVHLVELNGFPAGVEAVLNLPLPPVQLGAFGMTNLALSAFFKVLVTPGPNGIDFSLATGVALARKTAPFVLVIAFLGGGGWLEASATYYPLSRRLRAELSIGITATARLQFALGPIAGGVGIDLSLSVELIAQSGVGGSVDIFITILLWGQAQVFGFVSISLQVLLEAEYRSDGTLFARGSISIKVKICWCFTLEFSAGVEYKMGGGGANASPHAVARASVAVAVTAVPALAVAAAAAAPVLAVAAAPDVPVNPPPGAPAYRYIDMFENA